MYVIKIWDNRKETKAKRLPTINGRTWTRRVQWLEEGTVIKLKFEDGLTFLELGVLTTIAAQTAWDRFKEGATPEALRSIFGVGDIKVAPSRRGSKAI